MILEILVGIVVGIAIIILYEDMVAAAEAKAKKKLIARIKGIHLHHSLYGLIFFAIWFVYPYHILYGIGLGIIIRHTYEEKEFVFVDRS